MASYSNNHPQQRGGVVFFASPKTPCHPSNGYEVREEASPIVDSGDTTAAVLSRKFDTLAGGSTAFNDKQQHEHERMMPQDPGDAGSSAFVADEQMTLPEEPVVVVKTKRKRSKSVDASNKSPRRRSLRIRRKSICVEGGEIMSSHENFDDNNAAEIIMNGSQSEQVVEECQMKVTHDGSLAIAQTLEDVAMDLLGSAAAGQGQDELPSAITNSDDDEDGGLTAILPNGRALCVIIKESDTTRSRKKATVKSVLESLDPINSLNHDKVVKSSSRKKRRDTFDLSRRRGLTRSGIVQSSDDGIEQERSGYGYAATTTDMDLQIDTEEVDLKPPAINSATEQADETCWTDMITPKNGSNEVQLPNIFSNEISGSDNEPNEIMGSPAVKENLQNLTVIAIEEKMQSIFSEFRLYNYVSDLLSDCFLFVCPILYYVY